MLSDPGLAPTQDWQTRAAEAQALIDAAQIAGIDEWKARAEHAEAVVEDVRNALWQGGELAFRRRTG